MAQVILLAWQVRRPDSEFPWIASGSLAVVSPPQRLVAGGFSGVATLGRVTSISARAQGKPLASGRAGTQRVQTQDCVSRSRNAALRRWSLIAKRAPSTLLVARVIGSGATDQSPSDLSQQRQRERRASNMAVITPEGIVGKVQRVFEGSSAGAFDYRRRVGRGIAL